MYSDGDTIYYRPQHLAQRSNRQSQMVLSTPVENRTQYRGAVEPRRRFDTRREPEPAQRDSWSERVANLESTVAELNETIARLQAMVREKSYGRPAEPVWRGERTVRSDQMADESPGWRHAEERPPLAEGRGTAKAQVPQERRNRADRRPPSERGPAEETKGSSGIKMSFFAGEGTTCMMGEPRFTE